MRLRLIATAASAVIFLGGWMGLNRATPDSVTGTLPDASSTPYIRFTPDSAPIATALLVHGLNSNKEFMQTLAMALTDAGLETYVIDLPGHGDSRERFTYTKSLRAVEGVLDTLGGDPIVIGHSMGGAVLVDLAASRQFREILLLSPAPVAVEPFSTGRLLIVTGGLEPPRFNQFVPVLMEAADSTGSWWNLPFGTHSTALFDPAEIGRMVDWAVDPGASTRTRRRYGWIAVMILSGLSGAWALSVNRRPTRATAQLSRPHEAISIPETVVAWIAACGSAVLLLWLVNPMSWLGVFSWDYLIGFILIVGLLLWRGRGPLPTGRALGIGLLAASYVIGVLLITIAGRFVHLVPSGVQWLWFPILTITGLPVFMYEENTLRTIPSAWKRWGMVLLTRSVLWASLVTGVLLFNTEASFLVLIMHFIVVFWLGLSWMTGVVFRITEEAGAAALFASLVQAWVFASLFVRI